MLMLIIIYDYDLLMAVDYGPFPVTVRSSMLVELLFILLCYIAIVSVLGGYKLLAMDENYKKGKLSVLQCAAVRCTGGFHRARKRGRIFTRVL